MIHLASMFVTDSPNTSPKSFGADTIYALSMSTATTNYDGLQADLHVSYLN